MSKTKYVEATGEIYYARIFPQNMDDSEFHADKGGQFNCVFVPENDEELAKLVDAGFPESVMNYPQIKEYEVAGGRKGMKLKRNNKHPKIEDFGGAPKVLDWTQGRGSKSWDMSGESTSEKKQVSTLARLRINHTPIMGEEEVKGKMTKVEVVEGGTYKLEIPDGDTYFATSAKIRPYMQRFMYKRFVMGTGDKPNRYIKTIMGDNLNIDLKDNDGGFNCGKPSGWIKDFKALPEKMQDLIRQIKRVRAVFGTIELINPTDSAGNPVEVDSLPFFVVDLEMMT